MTLQEWYGLLDAVKTSGSLNTPVILRLLRPNCNDCVVALVKAEYETSSVIISLVMP
jgi:hypothetical protein